MATLGAVQVRFGGDTRGLERAAKAAEDRVNKFADRMESVGQSLSIGFTAPIAALGGAALFATADIESLTIAMEAAAGSAEAAAAHIERLRAAARKPGISLEGAIETSSVFQQIGFSAEFAERTILGVGRAVALSGGGAAEFSGVARQLRQVAGLGRLMGEEINVILENAPAAAKALQIAFGTTSADQIRKLNLSTKVFFDRLLSGFEALPEVAGGVRNSLDNLAQSVKFSLAAILEGDAVNIAKFFDGLSLKIEDAADAFRSLSTTTQRTIIGFVALAAAIGPVIFGLSVLVRSYQTLAGISLIAGIAGGTRAFFALVPAIRTAADAVTMFGFAAKGALAFLTGPAGIIALLAAVAAAFVGVKIRAAEAANESKRAIEEIRGALATLDMGAVQARQLSALGERAGIVEQIATLRAANAEIERTLADFNAGRTKLSGTQAVALASDLQQNAALIGTLKDKEADLAQQIRATTDELAARNQMMQQLQKNATTGIGGENEKSALDKLVERAKILLGIYDARVERSESALSVLQDLIAVESQLERIIRAGGEARTEALETALGLTLDLRDRWDEIFASVEASVTGARSMADTKAASLPGKLEAGSAEAVKRLFGSMELSFQQVATSAAAAGAGLTLIDGATHAVASFRDGVRDAQQGLRGFDRLTLAVGRFADELGSVVGSIKRAFTDPLGALLGGLKATGGATISALGRLGAIVNPLTLFSSTLDQVARNLAPNFAAALAPLQGVFEDMAAAITPIVAVIAEALKPVLEALVPIIEKLGPVIGALAQTVAPIIAALVPVLDVFRVILEGMFPIIKTVAIVLTYFGQVIFNVAGGIATAIGSLIHALGSAVDAIPFLGDFGLKKLGNNIKEAGQSYFDVAAGLAEARDQIKKVEIGDALDSVAKSARKAAEALNNVPEMFDLAFRRRQAALAGAGASPFAPPSGTVPGGSGGGDVIIHVNNPAPGTSGEAIVAGVRDAIKRNPEVEHLIDSVIRRRRPWPS